MAEGGGRRASPPLTKVQPSARVAPSVLKKFAAVIFLGIFA